MADPRYLEFSSTEPSIFDEMKNRSETSDFDEQVRASTFVQDMAESKELLHVQFARKNTRECLTEALSQLNEEPNYVNENNNNVSEELSSEKTVIENTSSEKCATPNHNGEANAGEIPTQTDDVKNTFRNDDVDGNSDVHDNAERDESLNGDSAKPGNCTPEAQRSPKDTDHYSNAVEREVTSEQIEMFSFPQQMREVSNHPMNIYEVEISHDLNGSGDGTNNFGEAEDEMLENDIALGEVVRSSSSRLSRENESEPSPTEEARDEEEAPERCGDNPQDRENLSPSGRNSSLSIDAQQTANQQVSNNSLVEGNELENNDNDGDLADDHIHNEGENDDNYSDCSFDSSESESNSRENSPTQLEEKTDIKKDSNSATGHRSPTPTNETEAENTPSNVKYRDATTSVSDFIVDDAKSDPCVSNEDKEESENSSDITNKISNESVSENLATEGHGQDTRTSSRASQDSMNKHKVLPPIKTETSPVKSENKNKSFTIRQKTSMKIHKEDRSPGRKKPHVPHQLKAEALWNDGVLDITIRGPKQMLPAETRQSKNANGSTTPQLPINVNVTFIESKPRPKAQSSHKRNSRLTFTYNEYAKIPHTRRFSDGSCDWDVIRSRASGVPFNTTMTPENNPRLPFSKLPALRKLGGSHGNNWAITESSTSFKSRTSSKW